MSTVAGARFRARLVRSLYVESYAWFRWAACRGRQPDMFFPPKGDGGRAIVRRARRICRDCPVRHRCLAVAMQFESELKSVKRYGIWGGLTPRLRANIAPSWSGLTPRQRRDVADRLNGVVRK